MIKSTGATMSTERLDLIPAVNERDSEQYRQDILRTNDFYFQYGYPYSDELFAVVDFLNTDVLYYSVFLKNSPMMVGYVGLTLDEDNPTFGELEFYIFGDYRRQGICKEALTAFIAAFFDGSLTGSKGEQVEAETLSENEATLQLFKTMGFQREAIGMRFSLTEDNEVNTQRTIMVSRYSLSADAHS
ncbi:MAG: GNAT family N-acetyltransferase [Lachnospiraceae bacterium]|nr:GNAT family N-acetyltransferase [Lachnospiraceae bacterium]